MTFFYNLNNKLNAIRDLPSVTHGQLNERDMSRAAKGYEKYGKQGMEALAKAGRDGKALDPVRKKYDKYDESVEEGLGDMARKVGGAVKKVAGKALDTVGHGSDADMIRDLQKKMGMPQTGMKPGDEPNPKQVKEKMSPAKAKSFAALAEPKDKITFADKIAGAKKEVDEMLGDVAAEAMKQALGGGKQVVASEDDDKNPFTNYKKPRAEQPKVGSVERGHKHDIEHTATGRKVTRRVDPAGISVGADDDTPASGEKRGRGRPKGPAKAPERVTGGATKHKGGRKMTKEGAGPDDIAVLERLMDEAFAEGNNALGNAIQGVLEKMDSGEKQVDEKAVSKKQQKFMGMVHAAQKGEKPASKEVAKTAKGMGKKDAEDFAATKHKGLPEKKKPEGKKEKTEETADSTPSKGGMKFGGGIYDSMNRELENMIAESMARLDESMSINMSMNNDEHGGPSKSITVTATDDDAMKLSQLLKSAGLGGGDSEGYGGGGYKSACGCGQSDCSCGNDELDEVSMNQPDYPTETETSADPFQYSGGLNKPKATGQTTTPVIASQDDRQGMAEGAGYDGSEPLDLSTNPSVNDVFKRALYIYDYEGYGNDMDYSEDDAIEQYVAQKFGQDVLDQLNKAKNQQYFGRADGKGPGGGGRTSNLGTSSAPGGDFRTTKAGKMHSQDAKMMKARVADRLGRHPEPNLPEQSYAESEQAAIKRMMEMAGIKKKEVDEEKTDEGNKFTGNLAKARAAGKKEADLDGDGDMEKVQESIFDLTNQWRAYKG
jgi:hypothetical protein